VVISRLDLTRSQILAYRRTVQALDERLAPGPDSLRRAAWAGLQDSAPRSALHSIHARVEGTAPDAWKDPSLVQVWGPRYTAYVVPAGDHAAFTLGRLPDRGRIRKRAEDLATRLDAHLDGRRVAYGEAGRGLGVHPYSLRYASLTGTILIRWEGARQPTVWTVPSPAVDPREARLELARRYLQVFGPATPDAFAEWAGLPLARGHETFEALGGSLTPVRTPIGDGWILTSDEPMLRAPARPTAAARLLPSGDPYFLLQGPDRELLVPGATHRAVLWTPRVWPGAVLVHGEIVGTWRRAEAAVTIQPWRRLSAEQRDAVEAEAMTLPLPELHGPIVVRWVARPG
jgi:winged helix DNA-binding protein